MRREYDVMEPELRRLRVAEQSNRAHITQLNSQLAEMRDALARKDLELAKLSHKVDVRLFMIDIGFSCIIAFSLRRC